MKVAGLLLCLAILPLQASPPEPKAWEKLENCRFVRNAYGDGDSFRIVSGNTEIIARLYFVDCPESDASVPGRVAEQADHFGKSKAETVYVGKYAAQFTEQILARRFSVLTKYEDAMGRSSQPRYYAIVTTAEGKDLGEILVGNGLARSYGMKTDLPGRSAASIKAKYDLLEARAKRAQIGIYSPAPLKAIARAQSGPTPSPLDLYKAGLAKAASTPEAPVAEALTPSSRSGLFAGFEDDLGGKAIAPTSPASSPTPESAQPVAESSTETPKNRMKFWSPEEEDALRSEIKAGKSVEEIAALHGRSVGAIRARVVKLDLGK